MYGSRSRIPRFFAAALAADMCFNVLAPAWAWPWPSVRVLLMATWQTYKRTSSPLTDRCSIQFEHRGWFHSEHVRYTQTGSEGQAYAMLRAVWLDDRNAFDRVWRWTRAHLQVRQDHLLAWLWAQNENDTWRLLDGNTASDADEDFALALVFAAHRWHDPRYSSAALTILGDIWRAVGR